MYLFLSAVRTYPESYSLNGNFTKIYENDMKSETISYFHLRCCRISAYMLLRTLFGVLVRVERGSLYAECFAVFYIVLCTSHRTIQERRIDAKYRRTSRSFIAEYHIN